MVRSNNKQLRKQTFLNECVTFDNILNLLMRDLHVKSNIQSIIILEYGAASNCRKDKNPDYKWCTDGTFKIQTILCLYVKWKRNSFYTWWTHSLSLSLIFIFACCSKVYLTIMRHHLQQHISLCFVFGLIMYNFQQEWVYSVR